MYQFKFLHDDTTLHVRAPTHYGSRENVLAKMGRERLPTADELGTIVTQVMLDERSSMHLGPIWPYVDERLLLSATDTYKDFVDPIAHGRFTPLLQRGWRIDTTSDLRGVLPGTYFTITPSFKRRTIGIDYLALPDTLGHGLRLS